MVVLGLGRYRHSSGLMQRSLPPDVVCEPIPPIQRRDPVSVHSPDVVRPHRLGFAVPSGPRRLGHVMVNALSRSV